MQKISFRQKITLVLLGIIGCIILLETGLRIGGGIILLKREYRNRQALKEKDVCRIMCVGGSTTADGGEYSYPAQLEEVLNEKDIGIKFVVINKGLSGCDSTYILSKLKENLDKYKPDIVITMMGTNDDCGTVPYEESAGVKLNLFLRSFRVYKLAKLIWLHGAAGIKEISARQFKSLKKEQERKEYLVIRGQSSPEVEILIEKSQVYMNQEEFKKSARVLEKAIEIEPGNVMLYPLLGERYFFNGKFKEGEMLIKKALEMQPNDPWILMELGMCYRVSEKYAQAETVLKKAIEINPMYREVYGELAWCYRSQGTIDKLQELCDKIIELGLESGDLYGFVATCYKELGKDKEAEIYYKKANEFRLKNYKEATRYNYRKLKEIVTQSKIQLVCMQYPVRNVEALKKLFKSAERIIFIDNENLFKTALKYGNYEDYFQDNFSGDFGHCTPKGNRLLAENVAYNILKKCFNK